MEAQATSLSLDVLVGLANLQAQSGEAEQAWELLTCVLGHSASSQEAKDRAQHLRAQLEPQLTPSQVAAAQEQAQAKTFDALVTVFLDASPKDPREGSQPSRNLQRH